MVLVLVLSVFALAGCGGTDESAGSGGETDAVDASLQTVFDKGVLRVGLCPEYPPFESINESNEIVGFDPGLADAIAKELGIEAEFVNTPWEGLIAGLNNGDFDVIISAMSPEEATAATDAVELSENYYVMSDVIVVCSDNNDIKSKEDLAGKVVGVQDACSAAHAAEDLPNHGIEVAALNRYVRNAEAYAELASGRIDALVVSITYANEQAKNNPGFKVINDPLQEVGLAVVAKQGSVSLIDRINEIVVELKENGIYDQIAVEWLAAD
ncbi:MAG TPA: amino acid ABC transporter substrate-binding protein [Bacteroidales bacterium]|nr:amino acid ABC transporter substrate-binding protein [Bacteroidales bacterium]